MSVNTSRTPSAHAQEVKYFMGLRSKILGLIIAFTGLIVGYYYYNTLLSPSNITYGAVGGLWFLIALYGTLKS